MPEDTFVHLSGKLQDIAPSKWFTDRRNSSFWIRLYTSLFIPHAEFKDALDKLFSELENDKNIIHTVRHILLGGGMISDLNVLYTTFDIFAQESVQLMIEAKVGTKQLKETNYIILAVPFKVDGSLGDERHTKKTLDSIASLIRIHTGQNFMREIVFEGEINALNGSFITSSEPIKIPKSVEGPFIAKENGTAIAEISKKLSTLHENKKRRIELALLLMNEAMNKEYGFFEYWTALEIVCDGKSGKIKKQLANIYEITSHNEAAEKTGFKRLAYWRHDFIHKGIRPLISTDVERYIQLLFLDLLRNELGLPRTGNIASIQHAQGYNLSPLGLKDNRTKEQKILPKKKKKVK